MMARFAGYPKTGVDPQTAIVNYQVNMFWDGMFHVFTWLMTALGLALLWRVAIRREVSLSTRTFIGSLLAGWGLFNLVEGTIEHQILQLHHVVEFTANHLPADLAFLASGIVLIIVG